jgi:ABC-type antimicrobial peptide transport system permease subunit
VGVVGDLYTQPDPYRAAAMVYHPLTPGQVNPVSLVVRVRGGSAGAFAGRLRDLTAGLDPALRLKEVSAMDAMYAEQQGKMRQGAMVLGLVVLSVLLLSAAGIYALMSFTVTQRRREIGVRAALGGQPRSIMGSIFSRAARQLAAGVLVGAASAALLDKASGGQLMGGKGAVYLPVIGALMLAVGLLAALGPARRGLRVHPTEALRGD